MCNVVFILPFEFIVVCVLVNPGPSIAIGIWITARPISRSKNDEQEEEVETEFFVFVFLKLTNTKNHAVNVMVSLSPKKLIRKLDMEIKPTTKKDYVHYNHTDPCRSSRWTARLVSLLIFFYPLTPML